VSLRGIVWGFSVATLLARVAAADPPPTRSFDLLPGPSTTADASVQSAKINPLVTAPPPSEAAGANFAPVSAEQALFTDRVARITELMSRIEQREGALFDELAERYGKLTQFTAWLERRDEVAFDERATRFARLVEFARKLRLEEEARESEGFEARLGRALRAQAFMQRLSRERAAMRIEVPNTLAPEPEEWVR
jgi:hypothetical protein